MVTVKADEGTVAPAVVITTAVDVVMLHVAVRLATLLEFAFTTGNIPGAKNASG